MSVNNRRYQTNYNNNNSKPYPNRTNDTNYTNKNVVVYNVVDELQDYMFTGDNLKRFNKHNFGLIGLDSKKLKPNQPRKENTEVKTNKKDTDNIYKPYQTDSLFWCFYILKYGLSKYEMEVGNQHFPIEKAEKFKYIETLRKNKDILKINKIKPLSELENDLANNQRISIKTFFALCIMEKINILLVDKRKIYESITADGSKMNVVHRNSVSFEHSIEFNVPDDKLNLITGRSISNSPAAYISLSSILSVSSFRLMCRVPISCFDIVRAANKFPDSRRIHVYNPGAASSNCSLKSILFEK